MNPLVLYHDNCPDGFTAAWAVWKALGDDVEYRAVNYGQSPPLGAATGRRVILVDFSYPRALLDQLADIAASVEVYDHHKTAQADLADWVRGRVVFDMERSGAGIAWDEFHRGEPLAPRWRPTLVDYVEDRDLWRWALPDSREVSEYVFSVERIFERWDELAAMIETERGTVVGAGRALLRAKRVRVETICKNVQWVTLGACDYPRVNGVAIPVVNTAWDFSEIGEYLCEQFPDAPCGGYWFERADKTQWGFRSRGDFDVSALCRQYGGGGHRNAAGFTSEHGWRP